MKKNVDVINLFNKAIETIPTYADFIKNNNVDLLKIKETRDINLIPQIDKKNYLQKYNIFDFYPNGKIPPFIYASSGSSGKPTFWFRGDKQEEMGGVIHEKIFRELFSIKKEDSTLVLVCFSMGIWIAGSYTLASCRNISRMGYNLTTITPGIEIGDILHILKTIATKFDNIVIFGYPPFLMDIFKEIKKSKVPLRNRIFVITGGDKSSEEWRNTASQMLNIKNKNHIINIYGSADTTLIGHENPFTIFLRNQSLVNKNLYSDLFGEAKSSLPAIMQYYPEYIYAENCEDEIVLTVETETPLVRYNMHDTGKILSQEKVYEILEKNKIKERAEKLGVIKYLSPIITITGRTDVATTFYALNIYPENIKTGIEDRSISRFLSGNFMVYNKNTHNGKNQKLYIDLELSDERDISQALQNKIRKNILNNLLKVNIEFRKLHQVIGSKAIPVVRFKPKGYNFKLISIKNRLLSIKGKKPRVII